MGFALLSLIAWGSVVLSTAWASVLLLAVGGLTEGMSSRYECSGDAIVGSMSA